MWLPQTVSNINIFSLIACKTRHKFAILSPSMIIILVGNITMSASLRKICFPKILGHAPLITYFVWGTGKQEGPNWCMLSNASLRMVKIFEQSWEELVSRVYLSKVCVRLKSYTYERCCKHGINVYYSQVDCHIEEMEREFQLANLEGRMQKTQVEIWFKRLKIRAFMLFGSIIDLFLLIELNLMLIDSMYSHEALQASLSNLKIAVNIKISACYGQCAV